MLLSLCLVSTALSATTGLLELAACCAHIWLSGAVWHTRCRTEVLDSLTAVLGATQQHAVLACWALQSQLIKCQALTASLRKTTADAGMRTLTTSRTPDKAPCIPAAGKRSAALCLLLYQHATVMPCLHALLHALSTCSCDQLQPTANAVSPPFPTLLLQHNCASCCLHTVKPHIATHVIGVQLDLPAGQLAALLNSRKAARATPSNVCLCPCCNRLRPGDPHFAYASC